MVSDHLEDAFASIIGPGVKLSIALYHFASPLGTAGDAMKDVGAEVTLFCATMRNVRSVFDSPKSFRISTTALHDVHDVLSRGEAIFEKIEALLNKLRNNDGGADLYSRVEDTFGKSKVLMWKESLRSCTAMVQVMLTTMAFAERLASAGKAQSSPHETDELRDLMQSLLLAQQSTNARLERLEDQTLLDEMQDTAPSNPDRLGTGLGRGHRRNRSSRAIFDISTDGTADLLAEGRQRTSRQKTSTLLNQKIYHEDDFRESQRSTWTSLDDHRQSVIQSNNLLQTWTDQLDPSPPYVLSFHGEYAAEAYKIIELQEDIRRAERGQDQNRDPVVNGEGGGIQNQFYKAWTAPQDDWDDGSSGAGDESNDEDENGGTTRKKDTGRKSDEEARWDGDGRGEQANVADGVPAIASPIQNPSTSLGQGSVPEPASEVQSWQQVSGTEPSVEIFKSFRVGMEDPCWKVLPAALRKYNINSDADSYELWIVHGDQERCIGPQERPLVIFKDLDRKGLKPMFMLRKISQYPRLDPQLTSMRSRQPSTEEFSVGAQTQAPESLLPSAETVFKDLRIGIDEDCSKVVQNALQKHSIRDEIGRYAIWIEYDDVVRCLGAVEMPLALFRDLQRERKKPKFMLRRRPVEYLGNGQELFDLTQGNSVRSPKDEQQPKFPPPAHSPYPDWGWMSYEAQKKSSSSISPAPIPPATLPDDLRTLAALTKALESGQKLEFPYKVRALHDYHRWRGDSSSTALLEFRKDEILEVTDVSGRWWPARNSKRDVGLVPSNYLILM